MTPISLWRHLRLSPFDKTTADGRAAERYRLALMSVLANVLSRAAGMVVMLLSVRITITYLGAERFGVWMAIASIVSLLSFMDFGVGNALANRVSQAAATASACGLRRVISGGLAFLLGLGGLLSVCLYILLEFLPWKDFIKTSSIADEEEIYRALMVLVALFGLSVFSGGVQRVFAGLQRAYEAHLANFVFSLLALIFLLVAANYQAGVPVLVAITLGFQVASGIWLAWLLARRGLLRFAGAVGSALRQRQQLFKMGVAFLILQIGWAVASSADNLIILTMQGAGQVAVFSIAQRLFQLVLQPVLVMNAPLWAAYADAMAHDEKKFIHKTFQRSVALTLCVAVIGGGLLAILGDSVVGWWTEGVVEVSKMLVLLFFLLTVIDALGNAFAVMLSGCGVIREQVITVTALTILALAIKPVVLSAWGVEAMLATYIVIYLVLFLLMYGVVFRNKLMGKFLGH